MHSFYLYIEYKSRVEQKTFALVYNAAKLLFFNSLYLYKARYHVVVYQGLQPLKL